MIDVLYVGPYRQNDEWGYTSKAFATLLAAQNINLVLRPVWFTGEHQSQDVDVLEKYEENKLSTKDILIQHGLPSYINYNGDFKTNIAVLTVDSRIDNTDWIYHLNLMDKIIVFSHQEAQILISSGICRDKVLNFEFPPLFLINKTEPLNMHLFGTTFYTIGTMDTKGGMLEVLTAYLSAFDISSSVNLIVCTSDRESDKVQAKVAELKSSLGIYESPLYYPNVLVINSSSNEVLNYVHQKGSFYVDMGYNCVPSQNLLRAVVNGSIPIVPDTIDIFGNDYDFYVETNEVIPVYPERPVKGLWSAEFSWTRPNTLSLMVVMEQAVQEADKLDETRHQLAVFKQNIFTQPNSKIKGFLCIN